MHISTRNSICIFGYPCFFSFPRKVDFVCRFLMATFIPNRIEFFHATQIRFLFLNKWFSFSVLAIKQLTALFSKTICIQFTGKINCFIRLQDNCFNPKLFYDIMKPSHLANYTSRILIGGGLFRTGAISEMHSQIPLS